ncbi:hypothetical protein [uncultured Deefgea sp.]|uniref:hypothetical protein n=1 Tax=uncultured Deefgea sp. TaxID=1304914 RepID=UPI002599A53F|nr:hypothetical protein [uncultured Deefgea sp.]
MTPTRLLNQGIKPALAELQTTFGIADSLEARRFLIAIALQESNIAHRRQVTSSGKEDGPAASYWQFEKGGGCRGVLTHAAVAKTMKLVLSANDIGESPQELWEAMRFNDVVAATAARLLIYTLPNKLPTTMQDGWNQYLKAWRPGKPHPDKWASCWTTADAIARSDFIVLGVNQ